MRKRILALLLALVMCLSLLPTAAFAEGGIDTDGDTTLTGTDTGTSTATIPVVQSVDTPMVLGATAEHKHCLCGAEHKGSDHSADGTDWSPWFLSATSLPNTNTLYYLTENMTLSDTLKFEGTSKNFYLCLNGHTITANGAFPAITVSGGATLILTDCGGGKVIYSDRTTEGCTVKVAGGTFKLYSGTITHAAGTYGSGVRVESNGTFEMYGGTITGNNGTTTDYGKCGGGVYIAPVEDPAPGGTFNMSGGTITGNTATDGGGVLLGDYGTFNMTGGEISGNNANEGGGVYVAGGRLNTYCDHVTFKMSGGSITDNNATTAGGGVYGAGAYHSYGSGQTKPSESAAAGNTFQISGTANVTGNTLNGTKGSDGKYTGDTKNNMYVRTWIYSIYVADDFSGSFGVTVEEGDWTDKVSTGGTAVHGTYWKVVKYDDSTGSSTSGAGNITYDNERFTFHSKGTVNEGLVTCNHLCGTKTVSGKDVCSICGLRCK